jgi:heme/copper-type cytochrome/quinol oxidase subunit 2
LKPLVLLYWIRFGLGVVAGLVSAIVATMSDPAMFTTFMNGITIALLVYLMSYYILKAKFAATIEKQSKIMTMGIFMYFLAWAVFFVLTYSFLSAP